MMLRTAQRIARLTVFARAGEAGGQARRRSAARFSGRFAASSRHSSRRGAQIVRRSTVHGGGVAPVAMRQSGTATGPLWFKDAIVYELPVKSFADGNNDGVGDFPGLIGRLDYLSELGVTCLWLMPFFPSPLKDDGYDISAYCEVHPSYGTLDDFRRFLEAAHDRRLQVIIELVLNHTSDQHPWFERARTAPAGSSERNSYVWSDTDKKYPDARIIFIDSERSNWTWKLRSDEPA